MFIDIENEISDVRLLSGFKDAVNAVVKIMPHGGIPSWITGMEETDSSDRDVFLAAFSSCELKSHRESYLFTFAWIASERVR